MAHRVVEFRVRTAQDVLEQGRDEPGPADADKGKSRCLDDQIVASRVAKAEMLAPHDDRENDYRSRGDQHPMGPAEICDEAEELLGARRESPRPLQHEWIDQEETDGEQGQPQHSPFA
jgi:hypothetical protein